LVGPISNRPHSAAPLAPVNMAAPQFFVVVAVVLVLWAQFESGNLPMNGLRLTQASLYPFVRFRVYGSWTKLRPKE
jgi:hypothetical protein